MSSVLVRLGGHSQMHFIDQQLIRQTTSQDKSRNTTLCFNLQISLTQKVRDSETFFVGGDLGMYLYFLLYGFL